MYAAKISDHASERIVFGDEYGRRTKLATDNVREILNNPNRHVVLGSRDRGEKTFILFYDSINDSFAIALQNQNESGKGKVITVLSLRCYNGPFPITDNLLEQAKLRSMIGYSLYKFK